MKLDLEEMEILLQRRYNSLREIDRLTGEMQDALSRGDEVSFSLLLDMRGEEMEKHQSCEEAIWKTARQGPEEAQAILQFMNTDPEKALKTAKPEERLLYEIRRKTVALVQKIQRQDQELNRRANAGKTRQTTVQHG